MLWAPTGMKAQEINMINRKAARIKSDEFGAKIGEFQVPNCKNFKFKSYFEMYQPFFSSAEMNSATAVGTRPWVSLPYRATSLTKVEEI